MGRNKKFKFRWPNSLMDLAGLAAAKGIRAYMRTLDLRFAYYDQSADAVHGFGEPRIYVFWHENILMPLYLRGHCNLAMLLSQHDDADILSRIAVHLGFDCVRGSTYRGAARAMLELRERSEKQHLTITPDGPRGPRRQFAQGAIYLASRLQLPLVAVGFGYNRPWRVDSWDHFAIPRPFSRGRAIMGPPMLLPPKLDREGLENCRLRVERLLNCFNVEAEAWAVAGTRKAGEVVVKPMAAPGPPLREVKTTAVANVAPLRAA